MRHRQIRPGIGGVIIGLLLAILVCSTSLAAGGVDDTGTKALGYGSHATTNAGWPRLVIRAHEESPKLHIFWPHPDRTAGGFNYVDGYRAGPDFIDNGPGAANYGCADGIQDYNIIYHTPAYEMNASTAPPSFNVIVENSAPRSCDFFFGRNSIAAPFAAGIFTRTSTTKVHLSKVAGKPGHRTTARYTVSADLYTDTGGTGDTAGLDDCVLVMKLEGTTITINANNSVTTVPSSTNCNEAAKFASRMHRLTYVKH